MSAQTNDSSGPTQRKSTRTRQKRSLGDDFIDPTMVPLSKMMNQPPPTKKKAKRSEEPESSSVETTPPQDVLDIVKQEPVEEQPVEERPVVRRRSERVSAPSRTKVAPREVKEEPQEMPTETKPELIESSPAPTTSTSHAKPPFVRIVPPRARKSTSEELDATWLDEEGAEEERLNNETRDKVAAICAANVQKILAKRNLGKFSTGSQEQAQNEEISRYVQQNGNCPGSTPKFLTLANKTIAMPPKRRPDPPAQPQRPAGTAARPLPTDRPTKVPYLSRQSQIQVNKAVESLRKVNDLRAESGLPPLENKPHIIVKTPLAPRDPHKKYVTVSNQGFQSRPGHNPSMVRTVTVLPHKSPYLDADGNPPGPSCREPYNTVRTVIARGPDGKPLPIRRFIYPTPRPLRKLAPAPAAEEDGSPPPLLDSRTNLVTVKPIRVNNSYETLFSPSQQVNYHPNQPQFLYPVSRKPMERDAREVKQEVEDIIETNPEPTNVGRRMVLVPRGHDMFPDELEDPIRDDFYFRSRDVTPRSEIHFLGAEEPMKDLDEDKYRFRRFEVKKVKKFTDRHLQSFGRRPPGMDRTQMDPGAPGMSAVLLSELSQEEYDKKIEKWKQEEEQQMEEDSVKYEDEKLRQQQARAQKLLINEMRIWNYMKSEKFLQKQKPESEMSGLEKRVLGPESLETFQVYNESLSKTNPELFKNLERIRGARKEDKPSQAVLYPVRSYKRKERSPIQARVSGPIRLQQPLPMTETGQKPLLKENNLPIGPPKLLKVMWNGVTKEVPEWIPCHLCGDLMRLCMRKSNYRGELREYPAYRCLRKGCQTFRSVKKILNDPNEPTKLFARRSPSIETADSELSRRIGEFLKSDRSTRVRKNMFDEMSKDFVCSTSSEQAARDEMDQSPDEDEEDELVEWSAYPGSSTATTAEELRNALLNCRNKDVEKVEPEFEEFDEDDEYNPYEDDEVTPESESPDGLLQVKQEIEDVDELVEQKPQLLDSKDISLTLHSPSC